MLTVFFNELLNDYNKWKLERGIKWILFSMENGEHMWRNGERDGHLEKDDVNLKILWGKSLFYLTQFYEIGILSEASDWFLKRIRAWH